MTMNNAKNGFNPMWVALAIAIVITAIYVFVYLTQPFTPEWNENFLNYAPAFAAGLCAIIATRLWRHFDRAERPYAVWGFFALSLWMWTIADVTWPLYPMLGDGMEVPTFSPPNACWVGGYIFFAIALVLQGRLVFRPTRRQQRWGIAGGILVTLVLTLIGAWVLVQFTGSEWVPSVFLDAFYPAGDLVLALAAWALARAFGKGLWARPWLSLLVFAFADALYTWTYDLGVYSPTPGDPGFFLTVLGDTLYLDAYLVVALACYAQFLLIQEGPRLVRQRD
jgi:hypothetical protein